MACVLYSDAYFAAGLIVHEMSRTKNACRCANLGGRYTVLANPGKRGMEHFIGYKMHIGGWKDLKGEGVSGQGSTWVESAPSMQLDLDQI